MAFSLASNKTTVSLVLFSLVFSFSFLSPVSLYLSYLRLCFAFSGLSSQVVDIDNHTTLHFWGPKITDNQKPSLLLIHGFGPVALFQWSNQVKFFSGHFNLYVPDLVFFGESTTNSSERTVVFQAECVAKLLEKLGVEKFSVMGTSYGGMVAYHMARLWPERIEKVVIANSGINKRKSDNEELIRKSKQGSIGDFLVPKEVHQLRTLMNLAIHESYFHMIPDIILKDFIHNLYTRNRSRKLELLNALNVERDETINISPLQQDVLLISGEHDQIFPLKMAYELQGLIGKNVKLEIIKDASHVPQIEKSNVFNDIVNSFLIS